MSDRVAVNLDPEHRQILEEAARRAGLRLASYMRTRALEAAREEAKRAAEREARQ